jgi:hypothetical protein
MNDVDDQHGHLSGVAENTLQVFADIAASVEASHGTDWK